MGGASVSAAFDPAAWLAEAEGAFRYSVYLWPSHRDGQLVLAVADPDDDDPLPDPVTLWSKLKPEDVDQREANKAALRAHLLAIGRIGDDRRRWPVGLSA